MTRKTFQLKIQSRNFFRSLSQQIEVPFFMCLSQLKIKKQTNSFIQTQKCLYQKIKKLKLENHRNRTRALWSYKASY